MDTPNPQLPDPSTSASIAEKCGLLLAQATHRINVLSHWSIKNGDRILEIGCGQGDTTSILAVLHPQSQIDALDPGPLDYGSPETIGQARERIKGYEFGDRISFHQTQTIEFLDGVEEGMYDVAVFCHCLWYFVSKDEVLKTLKAVSGKAKKLCIAEWSLRASNPASQVHLLAALTRATCEAHIPNSDANIRTPIAPAIIRSLALEAGWKLQTQEWITPEKELEDGIWETGMVVMDSKANYEGILPRARAEITDERVYTLLESMVESVKSGVDAIGGKENVRCMDVWVGCFE